MAHAPPLRPLIAGNWKMNGSVAALAEALAVRDRLAEPDFAAGVDVMLCPPAPLLPLLAGELARGRLQLGAQDCHAAPSGAHTGDLSAELLKDVGASAVIVGHSERRAEHGESDQEVRRKVSAAHRAGLTAIVCLGETAGERRACLTLDVIGRQLARSLPEHVRAADTVIAYEPVWAIGTGKTATPEQAEEAHRFIKGLLDRPVLYGGSVKPENAADLLSQPSIDGALVGGASLEPDSFAAICRVASTS
jgi:triosephosphate isomerase (TIM)